MGCGICFLDVMAFRCPMWDVGYASQMFKRWGLGGRQFAFNGIIPLDGCHNVLLMPRDGMKKDTEGAEWLPRVSISVATHYLRGACGACDSEFGGHLKPCVSCGKQTDELCGVDVQHKFHCYVLMYQEF